MPLALEEQDAFDDEIEGICFIRRECWLGAKYNIILPFRDLVTLILKRVSKTNCCCGANDYLGLLCLVVSKMMPKPLILSAKFDLEAQTVDQLSLELFR